MSDYGGGGGHGRFGLGLLLVMRVAAVAAALAAGAPVTDRAPAVAQRVAPGDTIVSLEALVVTADRVETPLAASAAAVSRLTAAQLARIPQLTLADALRQVPGFAVVNFDGLGYDPQLMVRGFYGGGEAEYVVVLVDGHPVNALQSGGIAWDVLPLGSAEVVEVVRGGASSLYGDAALGGVINIITRKGRRRPDSASAPSPPPSSSPRFLLSRGEFDTWRGQFDAQAQLLGGSLGVFGGGEHTDGFRDHAERTAWHAGGRVALLADRHGTVSLSALGHRRDFDEPGPLLADAVAQDRARSEPFFRFDHTRDERVRAAVDAHYGFAVDGRLTGALHGEHRTTNAVRTVALSPEFADTKERVLRTRRVGATVQLAIDETPIPVRDRLILGVDGSYGRLDSDYYNVTAGDRAAYQTSPGARGELDTGGAGNRGAVAAFAHYSFVPVAALRLFAGVRADWLRDRFDASTPAGARTETRHEAVSPRAGINVQYVRRPSHTGHLYATAGRSFKAPTLDQLYDLRRIPVSPDFAITTSNPDLAPQRGRSAEVGLYHGVTPSAGGLAAELSLAAYEMRMKDELDFDVQTLRYVNIGRSKHRGVEAGLRFNAPSRGSVFANYTLQRVTAEIGQHAGNYLKAIPRHTFSGGITAMLLDGFEAGAFVSHNRDIFLDDANTIELPNYTRVDARLAYSVRGVRLFLDVRNVFDTEYSTTGFPDPSGSGAIYYYPAAGRSLEVGVRSGP